MKIKNKLVKCSIMLSLLLLCSTGFAHAANSTGNNVQQKVLSITNGTDEIYGTGVPLVHNMRSSGSFTGSMSFEAQTFNSGGVDHTHQYILASALVILNNDMGDSILNNAAYTELLMTNTDWPDVFGNETDYYTFAGHFYDPDTEKNWLAQSSPTCKTRANTYFDKAVTAYQNGYTEIAMQYLGRGTHYVSDVNEPHHASNLTSLNSNHSEFEKYVDTNRSSYKIDGDILPSNVYQIASNTSVNNLMKSWAVKSKALVPLATDTSSYAQAGEACVTNAITSVSQYIYKFGKTVGIY